MNISLEINTLLLKLSVDGTRVQGLREVLRGLPVEVVVLVLHQVALVELRQGFPEIARKRQRLQHRWIAKVGLVAGF